MASITVDIQAKVVGYEASLKAMKDAFSKIDPGSDIGKSLEKAIKYAEGQLKNLNKNLTPKASSDTQIDSIIEKTNRAGEAIQEVSTLMQKVSFGDIDFSSFENGIGKLMSTLQDLETELESRVSKGLREAVTNSTELTESFSKLNIDVKDKSAGEIFEAVSEKALKAAEDTEKARVALENAQKNLNSQQGKLDQLESNPIYNKDNLQKDLQGITEEYTKTFDNIKTQIQNGLKNLLGSDNAQADKLMENFTAGLNPQTLKEHLMQLKNALQHELKDNNSAKEIYTALLGSDGASGNAQAVTTKLLSDLNNALPNIKQEFQNKVQEFVSSLTNKEAGQITTLISTGDIDSALKATIQAIERAYSSVKGSVIKQRAEVKKAMEGQETAETNLDSAQQNQQAIEAIRTQLQEQINTLTNENSQLRDEIKQIKASIEEKKNAEVNKIRDTASDSSRKTDSLRVSAEEAQMYRSELEQVQAKEKLIGKIEGVVQRWFSIYAAVRMVGNAIRSVISTVQELDKTITEIAIVTDMTQDELWGQMKNYTDMARQYAASISGVYEVSQLYYQQGLQTADVMALTEETLKMARISSLGYAEATDYMTNAVRSFKMEMTDAQRVVDVYSEIAASSATSTTELASAMSKTASSAEAVGSSVENTTAMMAVMIEATRESAENIGSAMKSIISRYGEMTTDPSKLTDSEGQEMSLNKVDKALKSVGISIQDTNHQFRDFDDVITELAGKWDTIDTNTQRYIATVMAGNRQQSRFLALVSNGERLAELSEAAANSQDAATLQVLKTMDSIEAKTQQLKTSLQSLYTSTGVQNLFKGFLDIGNQIVKTFTQMPTIFGAPIPAILKIGTTFASLANVVTTVFGLIKAKTQAQIAALNGQEQVAAQEREIVYTEETLTRLRLKAQELNQLNALERQGTQLTEEQERRRTEILREAEQERQGIRSGSTTTGSLTKKNAGTALGLNIAGVVLSTISGYIGTQTRGGQIAKGLTGIGGSMASMAGMGLMMGGGVHGALIGAGLGALMGLVENINFLWESAEARATRLKEAATEANNTYIQKNNETKTLQEQIDKLKELEKAQYDSEEARQAYLEASNEMAAQHPELVDSITSEGDAIINLEASYLALASARKEAIEAAKNAAKTGHEEAVNAENESKENYEEAARIQIGNFTSQILGSRFDVLEQSLKQVLEGAGFELKENFSAVGLFNNVNAGDFLDSNMLLQNTEFSGDLQEVTQRLQDSILNLSREYQELMNSSASISLTMDDYLKNTALNLEEGFLKNIAEAMIAENPVEALTSVFNSTENVKQELINLAESSNDNYVKELANFVIELYDSLMPEEAELKKSEQNRDKVDRSNMAKTIGAYINGSEETYLKDMEDSSNFLTELIWEQYKKSGQDYNVFIENVDKIIKEDSEALEQIWTNLSPNQKNNLNNLIKNKKLYNRDDFSTELFKFIDNQDFVTAISESLYKDAFNLDKFKSAIEKRGENQFFQTDVLAFIEEENNIFQKMGEVGLDNLLTIYNNLNKQIEQGNISEDRASEIFQSYLNILSAVEGKLNGVSKEEANKIISGWSDFSLTGINDLLKELEKAGLTKEDIQKITPEINSLKSLIPVNFIVELQSFSQKITSNIEDVEKAISNAGKGMDFKAATEMAQKLGKSLSDFNFKDGKFFFEDFAAIRDAYLGENEQDIQELEKVKNKLKEDYDKNVIDQAISKTSDLDIIRLFSGDLDLENIKETLEGYSEGITNAGYSSETLLQYYQNYLSAISDKTIDSSVTFWDYVQEDFENQYKANIDSANKYTNDQIARAALSIGNFSDFLNTVITPDKFQQDVYRDAIQALQFGDTDTVLAMFPEYASDILKYYQNINKNVYDKLISGLDSQQYINADEFSAETLQSLEVNGLVEKISGEGSTAIYKTLDKMTSEQLDLFAQTIINSNLIKADKDKMLASIYTEKYEDNIYEGLSGVVDNFDKFSYEAGQKLANSLGTSVENLISKDIINVDKITGDLSISYTKMLDYLPDNFIDNAGNMTIKQYNELRAKLEAKANKEDKAQIFNNIVKNRDKLSEENIAALGTILNKNYVDVTKMLHQNADGTYALDLTTISQLINEGKIKINDELNQLIANEIDNIISSLTGLGTLQNKGTTSIEDMQKRIDYVNSYAEREELRTTLEESFVYDEQLNSFVYSTEGLQKYAKALYTQLQSLKNENIEATDQIWAVEQSLKSIAVQMANNIDFSSVLDLSIGDPARDIKFDELKQAIEDYNTVLAEIGITTGLNTNNLIRGLRYGGENAVLAAEAIAKAQGTTLSAEDVEAAYRGQINNFTGAIDTLISKPGEIVDTITANLINENGGKAEELGNTGQYVVQSAANLYEAYNDLLRRMTRTGEATLADLNKVAALALENRDDEQQVIDALGDAAGMTFTRFGEILADAGIQLTEDMVNQLEAANIIDLMGGNKMKIADFQAFADLMNWDANSEEYVSAFKSYNDSLIDMNRQAERNILEEAQNVTSAKGGDWINLTQLSDKLSKIQIGARPLDTALNLLITSLPQFGAQLEDGILKLGQNANIPAIMQEIAQVAAESGGLLTNELAELADAVADAIKGYADLISGGIEGSLSNVQAEQLQDWASTNGIGKLNFTETADGLKVATDQAFELVAALRQVDAMQGKLTFDNLVESLSADKGGRFENISKTTAEIAKIQKQINRNQKDIELARHYGADKDNEQIKALESQNAKLREQLNLYTQIQQRQSIDPSQYNFMDRDIPEVMQGPINYWNSVGKAYTALNETAQTGKMDIQDFTNIVNEMSNLAATSGQKLMFFGEEIDGSAENAAALIQKGYSALSNVDGKGVQIDLSKMGIQFAAGADNAKNNFDKGVQSLADAQIAMLDAAIKVLEVVVAMEQLGDIDVENKGTLDLGEIFADSGIENNGDFTKDFKKWADSIYEQTINPEDIEHYNEDLAKALDAISIGGTSLKDMIYAASNNIEDAEQAWKDLNMTEQQYQAVINAFYQAMLNGDYNLDTIQDSVWEILNQTLPDGSVI